MRDSDGRLLSSSSLVRSQGISGEIFKMDAFAVNSRDGVISIAWH
jgi:hypothetical protein